LLDEGVNRRKFRRHQHSRFRWLASLSGRSGPEWASGLGLASPTLRISPEVRNVQGRRGPISLAIRQSIAAWKCLPEFSAVRAYTPSLDGGPSGKRRITSSGRVSWVMAFPLTVAPTLLRQLYCYWLRARRPWPRPGQRWHLAMRAALPSIRTSDRFRRNARGAAQSA
jgi:hypothetical protein